MTQELIAVGYTKRVTMWMAATTQPRVFNVFPQVANLINEHKQIISVVIPSVGRGPFSLVVSHDIAIDDYVDVDSEIKFVKDEVLVGELAIKFATSIQWNARPRWDRLREEHPDFSQLAEIIDRILQNEAPGDSIAQVLLGKTVQDREKAALVKKVSAGISALSNGLKNNDLSKVTAGTKELAGLGVGLTPAGDDFLVGVMYGLWLTRPTDVALGLSKLISNTASERTNTLSRAWLEAAAAGEAVDAWHRLLNGFAQGSVHLMSESIRDILPTGHTSGADALGGFLFVLTQAA